MTKSICKDNQIKVFLIYYSGVIAGFNLQFDKKFLPYSYFPGFSYIFIVSFRKEGLIPFGRKFNYLRKKMQFLSEAIPITSERNFRHVLYKFSINK